MGDNAGGTANSLVYAIHHFWKMKGKSRENLKLYESLQGNAKWKCSVKSNPIQVCSKPERQCCRRKLGHFIRPHTQAPLNPHTNRPPSPEHSPKIRRKEKLKSHEAINSGSRFHLFLLFTFLRRFELTQSVCEDVNKGRTHTHTRSFTYTASVTHALTIQSFLTWDPAR